MLGLTQRLLKINPREVEFARRGFVCSDPQIQNRLENIGRIFLQGYHAALEDSHQDALVKRLDQVELEQRGFAYEGAAMALALRDGISFRGPAFPRFIAGAGRQHIFMLHVGAGWAYARLPWMRRCIEAAITRFHPVLRWLVIDGYGFHQGYFHWRTPSRIAGSLARLSPDARHVFYQGLGRSLWFSCGADPRGISHTIAKFAPLYHPDAWSGVGLACAYAGGIAADAIAELRREAGENASALAQGAAFAAKARQLAGNPATHTQIACAVLCGVSAEQAAALCDETFAQTDPLLPCPYQHWQKLLQSLFSSSQISIRGQANEYRTSPLLVAAEPH